MFFSIANYPDEILSIVSIYIEHPSEKVPTQGSGWSIEYKPREDLGKVIVDLSQDKTYVVDEKYTIDINKYSKVAFMMEYETSMQHGNIEFAKGFQKDVNLVIQYISNDPDNPGIVEMRENIGSFQ